MLDYIIRDNLKSVLESISLIEIRFSEVDLPDKFVTGSEGVLLLDAISMRLQVIGELIKKIDKIDVSLLIEYPEIEWSKIMKLRDIISHHYERMDHEIIFDICKNHVPILKETVQKILENESEQ